MKALREKKTLTKFLILYKTAVEEPSKLADISEGLDMSDQATSNYVSEMEEENLIDRSGRIYHPTSKGMEFVREMLSKLGSFLEEANSEINFISNCTALASEDIKEGEKVGLFMEDGLLHASLRGSSSMGTALHDCKAGEPLRVGGLHGITDMQVGDIYMLKTDLDRKTKEKEGLEPLKEKIEEIEHHKIAVMGEREYGICNMLDIEPGIIFAPIEGAINAAEKGLDVLLMLSEKDMDKVLEKLAKRNRDFDEVYSIDYKIY